MKSVKLRVHNTPVSIGNNDGALLALTISVSLAVYARMYQCMYYVL